MHLDHGHQIVTDKIQNKWCDKCLNIMLLKSRDSSHVVDSLTNTEDSVVEHYWECVKCGYIKFHSIEVRAIPINKIEFGVVPFFSTNNLVFSNNTFETNVDITQWINVLAKQIEKETDVSKLKRWAKLFGIGK